MYCEKIKIYSDKYNVEGIVLNSSMVKTLDFTVNGKSRHIGLNISVFREELADKALEIMETCIGEMSDEVGDEEQPTLFNWCMSVDESGKHILHGNVINHSKINDSVYIHTSSVKDYYIDYDTEMFVAQTRNNKYHCMLEECDFHRQDKEGEDILPDYAVMKEKYRGAKYSDEKKYPTIEPGKALLVLANYDNYYYHSFYCIPEGMTKPLDMNMSMHVGMFQDSVLIDNEDMLLAHNSDEDGSVPYIDVRYFPHYGNIEFYSEDTAGMPFYVENVGTKRLFVQGSCGSIRLEPGERKEMTNANASENTPPMPDGDLYPAVLTDQENDCGA